MDADDGAGASGVVGVRRDREVGRARSQDRMEGGWNRETGMGRPWRGATASAVLSWPDKLAASNNIRLQLNKSESSLNTTL